jgi:hypothetical protein
MSPLDGINEKLNRADEHIKQLDIAIERFFGNGPNRTVADFDAESVEAFRRSHQDRTVPLPLSVIAGEILYHLRSSLDHLACLLILKDGGSPCLNSQFPIFRFRPTKKDDVRRYEGQIKGITRPNVLALIDESQPYQRTTERDRHPLAILKFLSNADKHRSLVLHVVVVRPSVQFTIAPVGNPDASTKARPRLVIAGHAVDVVKVEHELTADVAFPKFGDSLTNIDVAKGLRLLFNAAIDRVSAFAPYV